MTTMMLVLLFLPLAAAALLLLLDVKATHERARGYALVATLATMFLSWAFASPLLDTKNAAPRTDGPVNPWVELRQPWTTIQQASGTPIHLEFYLGVDGISLAMILLTTLMCVSAVLVSWTSVRERAAEFYAYLLVLEFGLLGLFMSFDLLLFYVFFEFTLIPFFLLIGIWGGPQRRHAANKYFMYMLAGSLVTLLGLVGLVLQVSSLTKLATPFSIPDVARALVDHPLPTDVQNVLFLAIAIGFLVKGPLFPFHTWSPVVQGEAPTGASALLVMKIGIYGILRVVLPMVPDACETIGRPLVGGLAVAGIIYASLCALRQTDIKKLVAYSLVAHSCFCLLGLFALNTEGIAGGVLLMVNHGLTTAALFCLVGMLEERYPTTRSTTDLGGIAQRLPLIAALTTMICFASIGLPGLNGFLGELLTLIGMYKANPLYGLLATTGVILGAWYLLGMLQNVWFGPLKEPVAELRRTPARGTRTGDLSVREGLAVLPLAAVCLWLGIFPQSLVGMVDPDVRALARLYETPVFQKVADVTAQAEVAR